MIFTSAFLILFLCLLLFNFQWKEQKSVLYLCLFFLLYNLRLTTGILLNSHYNVNVLTLLLFQTDPLAYLIGPTIYFYGQSVYHNKLVFNVRFLLLCSPSLLLFLNLLPYYQLGTAEKTHFISAVVNNNFFRSFPKEYALLFDYKFQRAFIPISNLGFILYTLYYLHKKKSNVLMKPKISKMIYSIINIISICSFPHILYIIYASVKSPLQADLAFRLANNNLEIFYLITLTTPLSFLLFPKLIYGFNPNASIVHYIKTIFANRKNSTLENNHSLRGDLPDDSVQIMEYLEKEKPYLNTEFSLHDLSRELNISHLKVSNFFNKQLNTPYPEYRNRLRVNHAIQLFKEGMHAQMSIEGIATVCGFKNKSRFYAAFKAEYQKTPTEWIEKNVAIIEHERESTNFKNI